MMRVADLIAVRVSDVVTHIRTPLYRNGYLLILSTVITSGLGLVYWALAARLYDTVDVGLNSAIISILLFLSGISQVNLQEAMIRYIPLMRQRTRQFILASYVVVIILSAIAGIVFYLGVSIWAPSLSFIKAEPIFAFWFVVTIMLWGIFVLEDAILTGLRQTQWVPIENAIFAVAKIALLFLFMSLLPHEGIFLSWTTSAVLVIIPINFLLFKRLIPQHIQSPRASIESPSMRQVTKYIAGNYVAALLSNLSTVLLPVIITQLAGPVANAHFYLTWIIASSLQIIASNMATSLTVEAVSEGGDLKEYQQRVMIGVLRLLAPLVALVLIAAPLLLHLMGAEYADAGSALLRLLALAALPNVVNIVYAAIARVQNKIGTIVLIYGANALLVLGLSSVLLPTLGITGVGYAWVISQTLIAALLLLTNFKRVQNVTNSQ